MIKNIVLLCVAILNAHGAPYDGNDWNGKWFPHSPSEPDLNPKVLISGKSNNIHDSRHGVVMGVKNPSCDDAKYKLETDWYMNPENYTCYEDRHLYIPKNTIHPIHSMEHIPEEYVALHRCMNESIEYNEAIPTFGNHRPLWGAYGEYTFLPKQRWLHNLEHGAVVMLYHPCAEKNEVKALKSLVKSCLYRHIITPYDQLTPERPLALLTWGHRLEMSKVSPEVVVSFIKEHALNGPEQLYRNGHYMLMLKEEAKVVSTVDDSDLCPTHSSIHMK
ncbi:uncharacterized protein LOC108904036 [Anoplophora glabripennis]|uniref:uncharacterized protein LOC108904036 n=1 Tax=Anoplophora glabripennis TaxID=217634 RepID=UPI000874A8E4|nr:uncharacterized protein LOC108904036 [Anoplophora glabripennis]